MSGLGHKHAFLSKEYFTLQKNGLEEFVAIAPVSETSLMQSYPKGGFGEYNIGNCTKNCKLSKIHAHSEAQKSTLFHESFNRTDKTPDNQKILFSLALLVVTRVILEASGQISVKS